MKKKPRELRRKPNRGLDWKRELAHRKPEDYLGAMCGTCIAEIPEEEREASLPIGEKQNIGEEKLDCASRSVNNIAEAKLNWLLKNNKLPEKHVAFLQPYLENSKVVLSDRWIAIMSGTDPNSGNSLLAPLDALHNFGMVPKKLFPQVDSKEEYYKTSNITDEINRIAKESLTYFSFKYSRLSEAEMPHWLTKDMLNVGAYAWPAPRDGEYPRVPYQPNHAFIVWKNPRYLAFDNYLDENKEGDFVKKLAEDYDFLDTAYRLIIALKDPSKKLTWMDLIRQFFGKVV